MRRINLFSYGMMSLLKLFARVLVIVFAVSLFQQAHSAQAVPVRPPHSTAAQCPRPLPRRCALPRETPQSPRPTGAFTCWNTTTLRKMRLRRQTTP